MSIYFETSTPKTLLQNIKTAIDEKRIVTWSYDNDGDFTHETPQWRCRAWMVPKAENGRLAFYIMAPAGRHLSKEEYGIYHGRFLEMMLVHFDAKFSCSSATAMPALGDRVKIDA